LIQFSVGAQLRNAYIAQSGSQCIYVLDKLNLEFLVWVDIHSNMRSEFSSSTIHHECKNLYVSFGYGYEVS